MEKEHLPSSSHAGKQNNLFSHLRRKNPRLYQMLMKLPQQNQQIMNEVMQLNKPMSRKPFVKKVKEEKRLMQEKFDIIRQSIESKKENGNISNQEIIKECNSLGIKNIARKYSEYKIKENFEIVLNRIKMQNMRRGGEDQHIYYTNKMNRTISGSLRIKVKLCQTTVEEKIFRELKDQHLKAQPIFITMPQTESLNSSQRIKVRRTRLASKENIQLNTQSNIILNIPSSKSIDPTSQNHNRRSQNNHPPPQPLCRGSTKPNICETSFNF